MNILIWGGGFENKGAEAMVRTVQQQLRRRMGEFGVHFFIESLNVEKSIVASDGSSSVIRADRPWEQPWEKWWYRLLTYRDFKNLWQKLDGVIDVSGYGFINSRSIARFWCIANQMYRRGKPIILFPQAWGPYSDKSTWPWIQRLTQQATLVYARDRQSYKYLCSVPRVHVDKIYLAPDITMVFEGDLMEINNDVQQIIQQLKTNGPWIGLAPNMRIYEKSKGKNDANQYVRLLVKVARHLIYMIGCHIVLIPHEIRLSDDSGPDDRFLCQLISNQLSDCKNRVLNLSNNYTAQQIKTVIGEVDMLIGSRFHAIVAAVSQYVPPVVIGWTHKYDELLKDVGLSGHAVDYVGATDQEIIALAVDIWARRQSIHRTLEKNIPTLRYQVEQMFDRVLEIFTVGQNNEHQ